ncbi:gamma-glutamyl-gamma-aminobutyrate hydrolase family protein [Candidatus Parcubacteria bacterium]|nr:gamma-glutamyl-gamma-aminobutyrate hydrolase family protein [Candidatus Parcubacteria bacterium]
MPNKILLIQFRTDKSALHEQKCIFKTGGIKKDAFKTINAFSEKVDFAVPEKTLRGINKVILGGSGEFCFSGNENPQKNALFEKMIKRVNQFIKYLLEKDIPTLGICFGHQLLAYNLGVKIVKDKKQQETGSFSISLTDTGKSSFLFRGLPQKFIAQLGHKDSLEKLPKGSILLAKNARCKIEGFQYKNNICGVQFHPELSVKDVIFKLKFYPDYSLTKKLETTIKKLKPSPLATKILKNFYSI